jgi:hypothetical protein
MACLDRVAGACRGNIKGRAIESPGSDQHQQLIREIKDRRRGRHIISPPISRMPIAVSL